MFVSIVDADGMLHSHNRAYSRDVQNASCGSPIWNSIHADDLSILKLAIAEVSSTRSERSGSLRYLSQDGRTIFTEVTYLPLPPHGTNTTKIAILARDVTERQQREHESRLLAHAISVTKDCFCLVNADGEILFTNPAFSDLLGYNDDEVLHKNISAFVTLHDPQSAERFKSLQIGDSWEGEAIARRVDGSPITVMLWLAPTRDERGEPVARAVIFRDITSSKRAEQAQDAVFRIGEAADRATTLEELYALLHQIISTVMPAQNFYIALYNEKDDLVSFPYFVDEVDVPSEPHKPGKGLTEYILRTGKSLLCTLEVQQDLQQRGEADLIGVPSPIWLGVPLNVENKTIGVMVVQHYADPDAYGEREKQILEFVSAQIARAIERKRAEQALKTSKDRYQRFVEQSSEGIWRFELEQPVSITSPVDQQIELFYRHGFLAECNDVMAQMFGFKKAPEVIGARLADFLVRTEPQNIQYLRSFVESGYRLAETESRGVDRDGNAKYFLNNLVGIVEGGILVEAWGTQRDITDRKKAQATLQANERRFRALIENSSDGIAMLSAEGKLTFVSPSTTRLIGYSAEALLGTSPFDYVHPDDRRSAEESFAQLLSDPTLTIRPVQRVRHLDGSWRWIEVTSTNLLGDPNVGAIVANFRDVTERVNAEHSLKESEGKYRTLFEESHDGVFLSTPEGKLMDVNQAGMELFGYTSRSEILNVDIVKDLYVNPQDRETFKRMLSRDGGVKDFEFEIKRKDGQHRIVLESASAVRGEDGTIRAYRVFLRDITDRKRLEDQLRQAQKMEGIGTLAGGIAHDFNNLLGIILGYTQLIEMGNANPERFAKSIDTIKKAVERGAGLVRQLLTFARKADPSFHSINVNETVREMTKILKETFPKTIAIENVLRESIPAITADATQVHQALLNLCVNARDAMVDQKGPGQQGGTLRLMTSAVKGFEIHSRFPEAMAAEYVVVSVQDTGIGMDETTKSHMFEPFFTTKELGKGTGLGLAVVYGVINSHHGFVDVESVKGQGTTFHLYFPAAESQVAVPHEEQPPATDIQGNETILVVEDEEMLRNLIKDLLESQGYSVFAAEDGMEGYEIFKEHAQRIALVLSDMGLPRLGGWEMFQRMRELKPDVQAILASGYFDPNLKLDMLRAGARDFIQKPYISDEILRRIREILDERRS